MNKTCNICSDLTGSPNKELGSEYAQLSSDRSNIIAETNNLVVLPSVGPLNDSHILIVPKRHIYTFAELPETLNSEVSFVICEIRKFFLNTNNEELVFFESGAGKHIDHSGGCIVHAHIHGLYASQEFHTKILKESNLKLVEDKLQNIADIKSGYVWYLDKESKQYICNNPLLPSQFLRYLYAESTDRAISWNWRSSINIDGIFNVMHRYKDFKIT